MSEMHTLALLVEDAAGVLTRVSSLIGRRGFNIHSLTVGNADRAGTSRITIRVECEQPRLVQLIRQLDKLPCVFIVSLLSAGQSIEREMLLIKVRCAGGLRGEIIQIANVFRASVIDVATGSLSMELTGDTEKNDAFARMLEPYGILEVARTGIAALSRGEASIYDSTHTNKEEL